MPRPGLTEDDAKGIQKMRETYSKAEMLLALPAFKWFLADCVDAAIAEAQRLALDTDTPLAERNVQAYVREALVKVRAWTEERRDAAHEVIQQTEP